MTPLQAFILGIVEGVTEYLPVSSTGHLILTSWALGLGGTPETKKAIDAYEIIIQGGAILAVLGLYRVTIWHMVRGSALRLRGAVGTAEDREGWVLSKAVVLAFLPAAVLGGLFSKDIKAMLFHPWPVVAALVVGGLVMLAIAPWQRTALNAARQGKPARTTLDRLTAGQALFIGCMQCVAMWPGTSRSLMTILAGLIIGLNAVQAAKFSFLLGLVTLCAASAKESLDIVRGGAEAREAFMQAIGGWLPLVMGILAAWASAALAVDLFVAYLGRHTLALFGWWRIALGVVVAAVLLWGATAPTIAP